MSGSNENIFGNHLRDIIEKSDKSHTFWALQLNVSKSAISQWLSGDSIPSSKNLKQFRDLVYNLNLSLYKKLISIFNKNLPEISPKSLNFKTKNLYDYIAIEELNSLKYTIETIKINSEEKEEFFKNCNKIIQRLESFDMDCRIQKIDSIFSIIESSNIPPESFEIAKGSFNCLIDKEPKKAIPCFGPVGKRFRKKGQVVVVRNVGIRFPDFRYGQNSSHIIQEGQFFNNKGNVNQLLHLPR